MLKAWPTTRVMKGAILPESMKVRITGMRHSWRGESLENKRQIDGESRAELWIDMEETRNFDKAKQLETEAMAYTASKAN